MSRPISSESGFRALAHPVRRRVLEMLRLREHGVGEIHQTLRITGPALSTHLRVLRDSGLASERRVGRGRVYRFHPNALAEVFRWVDEFRAERGKPARK